MLLYILLALNTFLLSVTFLMAFNNRRYILKQVKGTTVQDHVFTDLEKNEIDEINKKYSRAIEEDHPYVNFDLESEF